LYITYGSELDINMQFEFSDTRLIKRNVYMKLRVYFCSENISIDF